jgi:hypothetical protein
MIPGHEPTLNTRMHHLRTLSLLLSCVLAIAAETLPGGIVLAQRGAVLTGPIQVQVKGLSVGGTVLAWSDIAAAALPGSVAGVVDSGVVTAEGELLRGVPHQIDKGELVFASDLHGDMRVPLAALAAVIMLPQHVSDLPAMLTGEAGAVLANGERISGTMTFCNNEAVGIDTGRRVAQIPRQRIAAAVLRAPRPAQTSRERVWFGLATGDRLLVESVSGTASGLQIKGPLGTAGINPRLLAQVWCDGGRVTQLATVPVLRAAALDRSGAALPVMPGASFPIRLGGLPASDGVMLPARGEIAWKLPGTGTLLVWVACPAEGSDAVASVVLDGTVAWEQTVLAGAAPLPLAIPLKGATELALRAAPGPGGETARCDVAWCHPLLVK